MVEEDGMTPDDAREFIDYNTLGSLGYPMDGKHMPIVLFPVDKELFGKNS